MIDQEDEPTFTRFMLARGDNEWGLISDLLGDVAYSLLAFPSNIRPGLTDMYALGRGGTLRVRLANQADRDLAIPLKETYTYLEGLCVASDGLYVCGGQNQIYRLADERWESTDKGLYEPFAGKPGPALFSIAEVCAGTLVAVGSDGLVVHRQGIGSWERVEVPTNVDLHCVLPDGRGGAWISGDGGALLHHLIGESLLVDHSDREVSADTFDSLALYKGELYVTAMHQLLVLNAKGQLSAVKGPFRTDTEFHSVSASGDYLWATGDEHVYRLGPRGWQYLLCPDNR
jgi:hypothetical protein